MFCIYCELTLNSGQDNETKSYCAYSLQCICCRSKWASECWRARELEYASIKVYAGKGAIDLIRPSTKCDYSLECFDMIISAAVVVVVFSSMSSIVFYRLALAFNVCCCCCYGTLTRTHWNHIPPQHCIIVESRYVFVCFKFRYDIFFLSVPMIHIL